MLHTEQVVETGTRRTGMISHPLVKEMSPDCFFLPFLQNLSFISRTCGTASNRRTQRRASATCTIMAFLFLNRRKTGL